MSYTKTTWIAGVAPGISAINLNNIETQHEEALSSMGLTLVDTEVFNGNSPNPSAWTDLDISAVVGANGAYGVGRITMGNGSHVGFRPNGEAEFVTEAGESSPYHFECDQGTVQLFNFLTDSSGVIEWKYDIAAEAVIIDIIGYIPNKG